MSIKRLSELNNIGEIIRFNNFSEPHLVVGISTPINLTSDSTTEWTISASSILNSDNAAYKAFNGNLQSANTWHSSRTSVPQWLKWQNKLRKVRIRRYMLNPRSTDSCGNAWQLQGSNNGTDWTDIDTQSGIIWDGSDQYFDCSSNINYYYYHRFYVTANSGYTIVEELISWDRG
jgi:hypothetical protein